MAENEIFGNRSFTDRVVSYVAAIGSVVDSGGLNSTPRPNELRTFHRDVTRISRLMMRQTLEWGAFTSHDPYVSSQVAFIPKEVIRKCRTAREATYKVPESTHILVGAPKSLHGRTITFTDCIGLPHDIELGHFDASSGKHELVERIGLDKDMPYFETEMPEGRDLCRETELMHGVSEMLAVISSVPDHRVLVAM